MDDPDWLPPEDEEVPDGLQKKWDKEEFDQTFDDRKFSPCPQCSKMIQNESFFCLYCGERVFSNSGLLGKMAHHATRGAFAFVMVLIILSLVLFFLIL